LGWADGRNMRIDARWAAGDPDHFRKYAAELVALGPDVILAAATPAVTPLQRVTRAVPIVFVGVIDPVDSGLVASMSRPAGNATGFVTFEYALAAKWLELLKEIAPRVTRAAVLRDPTIAAGICDKNFRRYPQSGLTVPNAGIRSASSIGTVVCSSAVVVGQRFERGVP